VQVLAMCTPWPTSWVPRTTHGVCNAILLPVICVFNRPHMQECFAKVAEAMGGKIDGLSADEVSKLAIKMIRDLSARVKIPK